MEIENIVNLEGLEEFIDLVKCKICFMISIKPVSCKQCESVFCRDCLTKWHEKNNTCPIRCKDFAINEEPRLVKNILSKFYYLCKNCKNKICLNEFENHSQFCSETKICCPDCYQLIRKTFLSTHSKFFCENATVQCLLCRSLVKRKIIESNNSDLNPVSSFYLNRIKELEKELGRKNDIIEGLEMSIQNLNRNKIEDHLSLEQNANNIIINVENKEEITYNNDLIKITGYLEKNVVRTDIKEFAQNTYSLVLINNLDFIEGFLIVFGLTNGLIISYSLQTKIFTKIHAHSNNILKIKLYYLNNTKKTVLFSISLDQTISMWEISNFSCFKTVKLSYILCSAHFLENDFLITADSKGLLHLYDLSNLEEVLNSKVSNEKIGKMNYVSKKSQICCVIENKILLVDLFTLNKVIEKKIVLDSKLSDILFFEKNDCFLCISEKGSIYSIPSDLNSQQVDKIKDFYLVAKYQMIVFEEHGSGILFVFAPFIGLSIFLTKINDNKINLEQIKIIADKTCLSFCPIRISQPVEISPSNSQKNDESLTFIYNNKSGNVFKGHIIISKI